MFKSSSFILNMFMLLLIGLVCYIDIVNGGVSASQFKNKMLSLQNELRQTTKRGNTPGQPAASYMKTLKWDNNLAKIAQEWSSQCKWQHNSQAGSQYGKSGGVAENMYASTYSETIDNLLMSVTSWYNEYKTYNFQNGVNTGTTHYSILVNADSNKVGCGYTICPQLSGSSLPSDKKKMVVVCDYYPSGGNGSPYLQKGSSFTYDEDESDSGLTSSEIAAVVLCSVLCLCFVIFGALFCAKRRKKNRQTMGNMKEEVNDVEMDGIDDDNDEIMHKQTTPIDDGEMETTPGSNDGDARDDEAEIEVDIELGDDAEHDEENANYTQE